MAMAAGSSGDGGRDGEDWSNSRGWWSSTDWRKASWEEEEAEEAEEEAEEADKDGWWQSGGWEWNDDGGWTKKKKKRDYNKGGLQSRIRRIRLRDHQTVLNVCRKAVGSDVSNLPIQQQILLEREMAQQAGLLASAKEQAFAERVGYVMGLRAHEQALLHRANFMASMQVPADIPPEAADAYMAMNTLAHVGPEPPIPKAGWISMQEHMPKVVNQNVRPNLFGPPPKHQPVVKETFVATPVFASPGPGIRPAGAPLRGCPVPMGCNVPQMAAGCCGPQMAAGYCGSQIAGCPGGPPARPFGPGTGWPINIPVPKTPGSVAAAPPAVPQAAFAASNPKVIGSTSKLPPACPAVAPPGFPVPAKPRPLGPPAKPGAVAKTPP